MTILAIDASGPILGVSLGVDTAPGSVVEEDTGSRHIESLSPCVERVLTGAGRRTVDGVAVADGPGSFTGLRVAMAAAKGYALAFGAPLVTVGSLDALAATEVVLAHAAGLTPPPLIVPILDARKGRLYATRYRCRPSSTDGASGPMPWQNTRPPRTVPLPPHLGRILTPLDEPLDVEPAQLASLIAAAEGSTGWCAPGPLAARVSQLLSTGGFSDACASGRSAVLGVAAIGRERMQRGEEAGDGAAPRYLRQGDIGSPRKRRRFDA